LSLDWRDKVRAETLVAMLVKYLNEKEEKDEKTEAESKQEEHVNLILKGVEEQKRNQNKQKGKK
jgi:hypothetical protein